MPPPTLLRRVSDCERRSLLRIAQRHSEAFARDAMHTMKALDDADGGPGIEYVDSLNGIDVYEDAGDTTDTIRLRSFCCVEIDIADLARFLSSSASPMMLPGIVESQELVSLYDLNKPESAESIPEHAGVNWLTITSDQLRDSVGPERESYGSTSSDLGDDLAADFVVLSYQGAFRHRERHGWIQWCQSVHLPDLVGVDASGRKLGGLFSSGIVAVEALGRPGQVSLSYVMGVDLSDCDARKRRFLERAVWKRVMKLAAHKKSLLRGSLARTLSIASTATTESEEDHTARQQPECEPVKDQLVTKAATHKATRVQAKTLQPSEIESQPYRQNYHEAIYREPSTLEFRLTYYTDPDEDEIHMLGDENDARDNEIAVADLYGDVSMTSTTLARGKAGRPKSKSITRWV